MRRSCRSVRIIPAIQRETRCRRLCVDTCHFWALGDICDASLLVYTIQLYRTAHIARHAHFVSVYRSDRTFKERTCTNWFRPL
jgi:endonuclease IV